MVDFTRIGGSRRRGKGLEITWARIRIPAAAEFGDRLSESLHLGVARHHQRSRIGVLEVELSHLSARHLTQLMAGLEEGQRGVETFEPSLPHLQPLHRGREIEPTSSGLDGRGPHGRTLDHHQAFLGGSREVAGRSHLTEEIERRANAQAVLGVEGAVRAQPFALPLQVGVDGRGLGPRFRPIESRLVQSCLQRRRRGNRCQLNGFNPCRHALGLRCARRGQAPHEDNHRDHYAFAHATTSLRTRSV